MGSIIRFVRPRPVIRPSRAKTAVQGESREAQRSLFILIGSFFVTALVMCVTVVAIVSSTWTDVVIMSAFVLVFALLKIALANALIYTMLRYDSATSVPTETGEISRYRRRAPIRQSPLVKPKRTGSLKSNRLRVATAGASGERQTTT